MPTEVTPSAPVVDTALVQRLIAAQFPQWARLPLTLVDPAGSDHVIHRLGADRSVRLPRGDWAVGQAETEHRWLPHLAPRLPVPVPVPLALGAPALGYPWPWAVTGWLDGTTASADGLADPARTAVELAGFLTALQRVPAADALVPGPHPGLTADSPLADRDRATREAIAALDDVFDARALTATWESALNAPPWDRPPVWFHGDLHTGNLLTVDGHLSAVIDFGGLGLGDPARDLMIAWTLLTAETRPLFRAALGVDDATWLRGRGWALATGLNAYTAYAPTNPRVAAQTHRQITESTTAP
ncbi:aminoglycoside phosphotransferase family protein [Streptomyces sp. NPDC020141]|uniref:aminoglycoside phosphotransferase family protein n=1 Tax=Streptomyces sp. NPDC020141 TaxID=3365065 RepID=UPI00378C5856